MLQFVMVIQTIQRLILLINYFVQISEITLFLILFLLNQFTKQYCNLFADAGLMPKKRLARFLITPNAALPPCTPLTANHFVVGQHVDVYGKT